MHHDRHHHHHHHHEDHGHHGGCDRCGPRRDEGRERFGSQNGCGCPCCCCRSCGRGERGRPSRDGGPGRGFDEKRLVDTIVRLVTENVSREIEHIVRDAIEQLREELPPPPPHPPSCPECGK